MQMIRHADMSDLDALAALESECFPPAEAASRDAIADRLRTYADHFWLLFDDDRLTAAINGMVTDEPDLVDAMYADTSMHDERGAWQMLFSVCTDPGSRRERRASRLMRSVIEDARDAGRDGLVLTCKEPLIGFYERFGYRDEGVCGSPSRRRGLASDASGLSAGAAAVVLSTGTIDSMRFHCFSVNPRRSCVAERPQRRSGSSSRDRPPPPRVSRGMHAIEHIRYRRSAVEFHVEA